MILITSNKIYGVIAAAPWSVNLGNPINGPKPAEQEWKH